MYGILYILSSSHKSNARQNIKYRINGDICCEKSITVLYEERPLSTISTPLASLSPYHCFLSFLDKMSLTSMKETDDLTASNIKQQFKYSHVSKGAYEISNNINDDNGNV